jgi:hypothetical protein
MKIDKATPERIMKDLESARCEENEKRNNRGLLLSFLIGISLAVWWMVEPESLKEFGIAAYYFINNIPNQIQAALK